MLVLILRSAHAEENPQSTNERARVSKDEDVRLGSPSCFETHRSARRPPKAPVLASRCDAPQHEGAGAKHQPAAVRNGRRGTFIVSGLLFTMTFATPTCWPHRALKIMQGHTRAGVPSGAAVTFEPVVH